MATNAPAMTPIRRQTLKGLRNGVDGNGRGPELRPRGATESVPGAFGASGPGFVCKIAKEARDLHLAIEVDDLDASLSPTWTDQRSRYS